MSSNDSPMGENTQVRYKRKMRNYLLNTGLQLRYTLIIVGVAVLLTSGLGYLIYDSMRETSTVITLTSLVDEETAAALGEEFADNDSTVLWGIAGFGVVLVLSVFAAGILITHRIAGPLYNIAKTFKRVRDNQMAPPLRALRKGDELQEFFADFRAMHEALRQRIEDDLGAIGQGIVALEAISSRTPEQDEALAKLRDLQGAKQQSLAEDSF